MKIEFVTDTFPPDINGVAMTMGRLTDMLKEQGHRVHVTHTGSEANEGETTSRAVPFPGYKEVRIGLPSPLKLRKRWRKTRPDIVYVACESMLGVSAMKAARELKIPVIAGFHTNYHQYLKKYILSNAEKPVMQVLKRIHKPCSCTMVPSQYMKGVLEEKGFKNIKVLGRGVDTSLFHPSKRSDRLRESWGAKPEDCVVIIVGRVAIEKNLDVALNSINDLSAARKPEQGSLITVVVGDGPIRGKLEDKYSGENYHFTGMKTGEELAEHYASSDVMLFASETETFGNVILEALASGVVTASYKYAASELYIENQVNGYHAEFRDEDALKTTLREAVEHCHDRKIRQAALDTASGLTWASVATRFTECATEIIANHLINKQEVEEKNPYRVKSLFLSDIHLGTESCRAREVYEVISNVSCDKLFLNGDIIDGWALKRKMKWKKSHTKVVRAILKKSAQKNCEVIYTRGNHDDFLTPFLPSVFGNLQIVKEHVHRTEQGKKYLIIHGDGFDSVSTNHKWVAKIGAVGYEFLLSVNRVHNMYRRWRGKGYYSVAKRVKHKVKSALTFIDNYEDQLRDLAQKRGYDGIICGHIHTPADKMIDNIHYLNSGDWVETMSCVVEHDDGRFELLSYADLLGKFAMPRTDDIDLEIPDRESKGEE